MQIRLLCGIILLLLIIVSWKWDWDVDNRLTNEWTSITVKSLAKAVPPKKVEWVRDDAWFDIQLQKGCCPFAKQMYSNRYSKVEYRCCTTRAAEGKIEPLRAVGGLDYSHFPTSKPLKVLIQGDSLAEQHFLGMICHAWYSNGLKIQLEQLAGIKNEFDDGTLWQADIFRSIHGERMSKIDDKNNNTNNNSNTYKSGEGDDQLIMSIQFLRCNKPGAANITKLHPLNDKNKTNGSIFRSPDFYVVGGWHHGGTSEPNIEKFLDQAYIRSEARQKEKDETIIQSSRIIVVNALPNHFPGGKYRNDPSKYPTAKREDDKVYNNNDEVCDKNNFQGDPNINENLSAIAKKRTNNILLLQVSELYHRRGDAHIGQTPPGVVGPVGRDCLHFCIAPGVMDALTKMTLAAFVE